MERIGILSNRGATRPFSLQADLYKGKGNFQLVSTSVFKLFFHFDVSPVPADGSSLLEQGGGEREKWQQGQLRVSSSCWSARLGPSGDPGSETPQGGSLSQSGQPRARFLPLGAGQRYCCPPPRPPEEFPPHKLCQNQLLFISYPVTQLVVGCKSGDEEEAGSCGPQAVK